jgi:hypothetical protein
MRDNKFWRLMAVLLCAGLLYVGHGLHSGGSGPLPSLTNMARAGGVGVANFGMGISTLYTTNQTGDVIHVWNLQASQGGVPAYACTVRLGAVKKAPERQPAPEAK